VESLTKSYFVILSGVKDLVFCRTYEILRSRRSLRMTGEGTGAEIASWHESRIAGNNGNKGN
jgi:hypothetical protein